MATAERDWPSVSEDTSLVTTCGRRISVRRLRLAVAERPISRVTLDVGRYPGGESGVWAALTAAEARDLAGLLLLHARRVERDGEPSEPSGAPS
ncbi:hypothetical protein [Streptomyces sp. NPDC006997]|uniref:hypothetical protein n=1 Tax=Streptomyces sp. NPDC006997 TaxID=3155356 RepID=UPI0033CE8D23